MNYPDLTKSFYDILDLGLGKTILKKSKLVEEEMEGVSAEEEQIDEDKQEKAKKVHPYPAFPYGVGSF